MILYIHFLKYPIILQTAVIEHALYSHLFSYSFIHFWWGIPHVLRGRTGILHTSVQLYTSVQQSTTQFCCTHYVTSHLLYTVHLYKIRCTTKVYNRCIQHSCVILCCTLVYNCTLKCNIPYISDSDLKCNGSI